MHRELIEPSQPAISRSSKVPHHQHPPCRNFINLAEKMGGRDDTEAISRAILLLCILAAVLLDVTVLYVYRFCGKPQTRFPDSGPQTERGKGMEPILQIQT